MKSSTGARPTLVWGGLTDEDWNSLRLITQHMDPFPDFQQRMLPIFLQHRGEGSDQYRYLTDRISCCETGTQRFGTQDKISGYKRCRWDPERESL